MGRESRRDKSTAEYFAQQERELCEHPTSEFTGLTLWLLRHPRLVRWIITLMWPFYIWNHERDIWHTDRAQLLALIQSQRKPRSPD